MMVRNALAGLTRISLEGKDAIRAAVVELEKAGYVTRSRVRNEKGHLQGTEYVIRERPVFSAQPALEEPASENPTLEDTTQLNKDKNKITDSQITESFPFPSSLPTAFASVPAQPSEAKGRKRSRSSGVSQGEMDTYREMIRENIGYDDFVREHPYDAAQLDEMVELMVEAVCSRKKNIRVAGNDFPQAVVKSRLLKLDSEHIRFVFDCLRENTTQVRNMKQYLLTVLYNAPATIENHYAAQVNHDLYGGEAA